MTPEMHFVSLKNPFILTQQPSPPFTVGATNGPKPVGGSKAWTWHSHKTEFPLLYKQVRLSKKLTSWSLYRLPCLSGQWPTARAIAKHLQTNLMFSHYDKRAMQEKSNPKLHFFFINAASDVLSTLGQNPVIANDPPTYLEISMMASPQLLKASEKKDTCPGKPTRKPGAL